MAASNSGVPGLSFISGRGRSGLPGKTLEASGASASASISKAIIGILYFGSKEKREALFHIRPSFIFMTLVR
jgi:hypothetical protein